MKRYLFVLLLAACSFTNAQKRQINAVVQSFTADNKSTPGPDPGWNLETFALGKVLFYCVKKYPTEGWFGCCAPKLNRPKENALCAFPLGMGLAIPCRDSNIAKRYLNKVVRVAPLVQPNPTQLCFVERT